MFLRAEAHGVHADQTNLGSNTYFPLGAVLFTQSPSYAETFKVVTDTGAAFEQFSAGEGWNFNPSTGVEAQQEPLSSETVQALGAELARYTSVWQTTFAPIGVPGYKVSLI